MKPRIVIAEDDRAQREVIADILALAGYDTGAAEDGAAAIRLLKDDTCDVLLTDLKMPDMDGLRLLRESKRLRPDAEVILMTAHASVRTAVAAMKEGAVDYLEKPFDKEELLVVVAKAIERRTLRRENEHLRELVADYSSMGNIVGDSPAMRQVFDRVRRAVRVNSTVLILGESGTGKELIARHIHFAGPRKDKPFVVVNCAAVPENLVESELFGHEKGAFTGAETSRPGKFEAAHGGTIFLDEIGDMRLDSQAKLLRVLQDGAVERVGGNEPRQVDVRVIVATNRNLRERVSEGRFREDLYFRLEVLPVPLPPLRDRLEDLPLLVQHFRQKLGRKLGAPPPRLDDEAMNVFRRYAWPGNVRELENTLEQLFILADGGNIGAKDLPGKFVQPPAGGAEGIALPPGGIVLEELEQTLIRQALERSKGRLKDAAALLGLSYKTLQYRLQKHGIARD